MTNSNERFWSRVSVGSEVDCWLWTGCLDSRGYGHAAFRGRKTRAHRLAYELTNGPIPNGSGHHGIVVMHKCDNRMCCNPKHLVIGSHEENMHDMAVKGRRKGLTQGTMNGRAVLMSEQVKAIRADPRGSRAIASDYPVSRSAIQRIRTGKAWASLS